MAVDESASDSSPRSRGLSRREAEERLRKDGPNALPVHAGRSVVRQLAEQMVHFFALLLWAAAGMAVLAGMPALGIAIAVVVILNGVVAFVQEHRAERAARKLGELLPRRAMVIRDGQRSEIDASELVIGDLVVLGTGDRVSADVELVRADALSITTAALTGESVPIAVEAGALVHAGSFVSEGEAEGIVKATGSATRLAAIAKLTTGARRPPSPLARELKRVARAITFVAVTTGAVFLAVAWAVGIPLTDGLIFAIGVTVALVPEALLPTVTLSLAVGAQRMAQKHALVRRLEAVEALGATTFLCTDKTGTLTMGEMAVVEVWTPTARAHVRGGGYEPRATIEHQGDAQALATLAAAAARCCTGRAVEREGRWIAEGDPMEAALDVLARRLDATRIEGDERARFPFDARRRRMSVVVGHRVLVKGAPDSVLPACLASGELEEARHALEAMTAAGLRVLAVAERRVDEVPTTAEAAERELALLGLVGLEDPPRPSASRTLADLRRAGVKVAMITGDHPATARTIAREVGLLGPANLVLTGAELPTDDARLGALMDHDGIVVSRVTPEDKLRIARALQQRGHVVAMTGDGVNDGPALQAADVGVAMGRGGTDVAREAADLVLLDDELATVVTAIEHGRALYDNVRRFLTYHLTSNVAEVAPFVVWALSGGHFPLALGVLQILALDIGTDTFTAVALGGEPPERGALERPLDQRHLLDRVVARRAFAVLGLVQAVMTLIAFLVSLSTSGWRFGAPFPSGAVVASASGAAFLAVVAGQAANAFACRSETSSIFVVGWRGNPLLVGAVLVALAVTTLLLTVPGVAEVLTHTLPPLEGALVALLTAPAVVLADTLEKAVRRKYPPHRHRRRHAGGRSI
jgi:calcium-translocating P-type ATPase